LAVAGAFCLLTFSAGTNHSDIAWLFIYQGISLVISISVIIFIRVLKGAELEMLRIGDLRAQAKEMKFLGVKTGESWLRVGATFAFVISLGTAIYIYLAYESKFDQTEVDSWLLSFSVAIPLSVFNAFNEEIITRWSIIESFAGTRFANWAPWLSAIVFGAVHYFGIPGGLVGSLMAGFLAWLLSRSMQDTRGVGWAWFVHFLQDVIILTVVIAVSL
jgi:hypothetical protein